MARGKRGGLEGWGVGVRGRRMQERDVLWGPQGTELPQHSISICNFPPKSETVVVEPQGTLMIRRVII